MILRRQGSAREPAARFDGRALATQLFDGLRVGCTPAGGVTRESYGPGEQAAMKLIEAAAATHGLATAWDAAANLVITLEGRYPSRPFVACGSHLDSVPDGGNFDGAAGVVAGLVCLARMRAEAIVPTRTIKLMALRGEESAWFGKSYVGSSALFGKLNEGDLALRRRGSGERLGEAMHAHGADVRRITRGEQLLDPKSVGAYLELHIEQGPVMVTQGLATAVVGSIRGNIRHNAVLCIGEAGHSGAVPRALRRDALLATADLIMRLDARWKSMLDDGHDLVVTAGKIGTDPDKHAITRIPEEVSFSIDIRSESTATLEAFYGAMRAECDVVSAERRVEFRFDRRIDTMPGHMDDGWIERLVTLSKELGLPSEILHSGAGHDAAVFANAGVPSAMIFIRNDHGSHNPKEAMEIDDFMKGTELLYHALGDTP